MSTETLKRSQLKEKNWNFGNEAIAAPSGYDPNATSQTQPPLGWHTMEIWDYEVEPNKEQKWKGESCFLDSLWLRLRVADGKPHAGAGTTDFLPLPTLGGDPVKNAADILPGLATRWIQFLKRAIGQEAAAKLPDGVLAPAGFSLESLIGKRLDVKMVLDEDRDGNAKVREGIEQHKVGFFGYDYEGTQAVEQHAGDDAAKPASGKRGKSASKSGSGFGSGSAPANQDFQL